MKRKITCAIMMSLFISFATSVSAQLSGFYNEDFEGTFPPPGWRTIDVLDYHYVWQQSPYLGYSGTHSAYIGSAFGQGEDWLILPRFTVAVSDSFSFYLTAESLGFIDSTIVLVSTTTPDPSSFTTVLATLSDGVNYPKVPNKFLRYQYSLSAFAGKNIYVAFKNRNYEGDGVYIDLVSIGTNSSAYCLSKGFSSSRDWIDLVALGTIKNKTGSNGGYADFTNLVTDLAQGSIDSIALSSELSGAYTQTWRVWIDYNQDGDFLDNAEQVLSFKSTSSGVQVRSIKVPPAAKTGTTRMRVSVKKGGQAQSPCEIFNRGEVEDYSVNIIPPSANAASLNSISTLVKPLIVLSESPNPAANYITINMEGFSGTKNIEVYNETGKVIISNKLLSGTRYMLDVSKISNGVYVLRVSDGAGNVRSVKWVKQ